jgi:hypothetical protein
MRKVIAATAVVVGIVLTPTAAFAGEITGNGKPTPIDSFNANSICSFSGQNDDPTGGGNPFEAGHVQNWGHTKNVAKDLLGDGHGASAITDLMHQEGPGTNCNGHTNGLHP